MSDSGHIDGVLFFGAPIRLDSDLHEALREIDDEICPRSPEVMLDDDPKYAAGLNPKLPLARHLRASRHLRDSRQIIYDPIPGSHVYLGFAGDRDETIYFLSDHPIYTPNRHVISVELQSSKTKAAAKTRVASMEKALSALGVDLKVDVEPIGDYLGSRVW